MNAIITKPNGYDMAFTKWFRKHGWRIWRVLGQIEVWTFNDAHCPFRVTNGMIDRLREAKWIIQTFPQDAGVFDEWFITPEWMPDSFTQSLNARSESGSE